MADSERGTWHVVEQGEWLSKIAAMYWLLDANTIWDHPNNAELKSRRDPEMLFPNDRLFIPELPPQPSRTGEKQTLKIELPPPEVLRVTVLNADGSPLANKTYHLKMGEQEFTGTSTGAGEVIVEGIKLTEEHSGTLDFPDTGVAFFIDIGHLNPAGKASDAGESGYDDGISGVQMRLTNLGFDPGPFDGKLEARTREAIRQFQILTMERPIAEASGGLDDETRDAIIEAYGS